MTHQTTRDAQAALVRAAASFVRDTYSGEWADDAAATLETDADLIERGEPCSLLRLAEAMQPAAVSAVVEPPAGQTTPSQRAGLRDRIRRVLCERDGQAALWGTDMLEPDEYGADADAVLAVLYREWPWLRAEAEDAAPPADQAAPELTAEEARALADDLGLQLYRAQDALAFVAECCDIADREGRQVTAANVREWLKGARCGRQLAADATGRGDCPDLDAIAARAADAQQYGIEDDGFEQLVREDVPALITALRRMADETATETPEPHRGDAFEQWLKARRDEWAPEGCQPWQILDQTLEEYRLHADTGTPLGEHVCEARVVGDCECLEQPAAGARQADETASTRCTECGHPKSMHGEGEDPVTPGRCTACPDDDAWHDYQPTAGARQDGSAS